MGCTSGRPDLTPEEATLVNGELTLLYENHLATEIVKLHKANSSDGLIKESQWNGISKKLNLAAAVENPSDQIVKFYSHFRKEEGYSLHELLLLGILLARGSSSSKAGLLFDLYDPNGSQSLKATELPHIINDLFVITTHRLPLLVKKDDPNHVSEEDLKVHIERIVLGKDQATKDFIDEIVSRREVVNGKETITKSETVLKAQFVAWFEKEGNTDWISSRGFNDFLRKRGKALQRAQKKGKKEGTVEASVKNPVPVEAAKPVHPKTEEHVHEHPHEHEEVPKPEHEHSG